MKLTNIEIDLPQCIDIINTIILKTKESTIKLSLIVIRNYLTDLLYEGSEEDDVQFPENTECHNGGFDLPF